MECYLQHSICFMLALVPIVCPGAYCCLNGDMPVRRHAGGVLQSELASLCNNLNTTIIIVSHACPVAAEGLPLAGSVQQQSMIV
jgi:hypothetical protein